MIKRGMAPAHPGEILKFECIEPLGLSVREVAEGLGVSRQTLSRIINGQHGISPEMAVKLGKAFGNGPELWVNLQSQYDLWYAEQKVSDEKITRFHPKSA